MSLTKQIATNTVVQLAGKVVSTLIGIAVVVLLTRYLGPDGYGQYTIVITFLSFFGIIGDFGLTLITTQMISERGALEERILRSIFTFRIISSFILFSLAPIVAFFTPYPAIVRLGIALAAWSFFFVSLQQIVTGVFQKYLEMHFVVLAELLGRIGLLAVTAWAVWSGKNLIWLLGAVVLGNVITFFALNSFARRFVKIGFEWDSEIIRDMARRAAPIAVSIVFNLVYLKADMLILSLVRSSEEVGWYGAAYRVIDIALMAPVMVMGLVLPIARASWISGERERFIRIMNRVFAAFVAFGLPITVGGMFVASPLMVLIAGDRFSASGIFLKILLLAFFATVVSALFGHLVVALNEQRRAVWIYGVNAAFALFAYIIFIPKFGATAAALATFGSELFAAGSLVLFVFSRLRSSVDIWRVRIDWHVPVRAIAATGIMAIVIMVLPAMHVALIVGIAAVVYLTTLFILRVPQKLW